MKFAPLFLMAVTLFTVDSTIAQDTMDKEGQTKAEFIEYAKSRLEDRSDEFFEKAAAAVDKDGDGIISVSEFEGRMAAIRPLMQRNAPAEEPKEEKGEVEKSDYEKNSRRAAPKDSFPVFDDPKMASVADSDLSDDEPVIGIEINGEAKAYPISIMGRHELGNDSCGETPITVSW